MAEESQAGRIRYIRTGELLASDAEYARTYYHYASDEMGSITHVVADGEVLNRYEYDAWGNLTVCEETVPNRFRFNGQQYDPVSQQYYLRARYYNPVIGRFTQEDTYRGDGLNLYTYCRNNPVCYVDPSGHAVISCERAQEYMLRARDAGQRIQDIDTKTANQLRRWYQFKDKHDLLTQDERNLASQIGLDVEGTSGGSQSNTKPYANHRPSFRKGVIEKVWESAKGPDGLVRDPNTGEIINWTLGESRKGVWDMGHISEAKYSEMHEAYMNGELTTKEFVDWYNDPANYRPELPSNNRSHKYE